MRQYKKIVSHSEQPSLFPAGMGPEDIIIRHHRRWTTESSSGVSFLDLRIRGILIDTLKQRLRQEQGLIPDESWWASLELGRVRTLLETNTRDILAWYKHVQENKAQDEPSRGYPYSVRHYQELTWNDQLYLFQRRRLQSTAWLRCSNDNERQVFESRIKFFTNNSLRIISELRETQRQALFRFIDTLPNNRYVGDGLTLGFMLLWQSMPPEIADMFFDPYLLADPEAARSSFLFKETICELLGKFCSYEHGEIITVNGIDKYVAKIKQELETVTNAHEVTLSRSSSLKGIFGEMLVAYHYECSGQEVVGFNVIVDEKMRRGREVDLYVIETTPGGIRNLLSIEVKNWNVNNEEQALQLVTDIHSQLSNEKRSRKDLEMAEKYRCSSVVPMGVLVRHTKISDLVGLIAQQHGLNLKIIPLCPQWLAKGDYREEV